MARIGHYKIESNSMNSLPRVHVETYQRRSGVVRHGAEHDSVRRHLAPVVRQHSKEEDNISVVDCGQEYLTFST
jgi:endonuclease III